MKKSSSKNKRFDDDDDDVSEELVKNDSKKKHDHDLPNSPPKERKNHSQSDSFGEIPFPPPHRHKPDAFEEPDWDFPQIIYEPFNLEPEFMQLQHKFKLSELVNSM